MRLSAQRANYNMPVGSQADYFSAVSYWFMMQIGIVIGDFTSYHEQPPRLLGNQRSDGLMATLAAFDTVLGLSTLKTSVERAIVNGQTLLPKLHSRHPRPRSALASTKREGEL
jgi:hypothetical protein